MANINIAAGQTFVGGTTGDDTVTLTDALGFTATLDGNGGSDALVLNSANIVTEGLVALLTGSDKEVSYDATAGTWTIDDDTNDVAAATLTDGFSSVTFADGITLEAGVASSGTIPTAPATADGVAAGTGAVLTNLTDYNWTGSAASTTAFVADRIVSVDGISVADAGSAFTNASGAFVVDSANETVTFTPNAAAVSAQGNVGETASFSFDVVVGNAGGDTRTVTVKWEAPITYSNGDDVFVGAAGSAHTAQDGLAGNDALTGAELNDGLTGGEGNDTLTGNAGNDTLIGGAGDDELNGGDGIDILNEASDTGPTAGNNILRGDAGNDTITGGDGNDILRGGGDSDSIAGGNGNDTIFAGNGDDSIGGGVQGGNGEDMINGGAGNDLLAGDAGNDELRGGDGNDTLNGGADNDILRGGEGADSLSGGAGKDFLYTSKGDGDILNGGSGSDTFVLKAGTGTTTIQDFMVGDDKMDVSALGYSNVSDFLANAYEVGGAGAGVVLEIDAETTVTLSSVTLASLGELDFIF